MSGSRARRGGTRGGRPGTAVPSGVASPPPNRGEFAGHGRRCPFRPARNDPDGSCGTTGWARTLAVNTGNTGNGGGGGAMRDDLDDRLHDSVAVDEIDAVLGLSRGAAAEPPARPA